MDETPAGRIHGIIKSDVCEDLLSLKHLMPGSYTLERNPAETGWSALLPQNRPLHNPNNTELNSLGSSLWDGSTLRGYRALLSPATLSASVTTKL